jgi:phage FluMu protein Com
LFFVLASANLVFLFFRTLSVWGCGKVIAEPKVTVYVGNLSCLKGKTVNLRVRENEDVDFLH